jgi:hypothetical protein
LYAFVSMKVGIAAMTYHGPIKRGRSTFSTVFSGGREVAQPDMRIMASSRGSVFKVMVRLSGTARP